MTDFNLDYCVSLRTILAISFIVVLVILLVRLNYTDSFSNKPSDDQKNRFATEILANQPVFRSSMYNAKDKMPWLDAITYEDARELIRKNNFNRESIMGILN